MSAKTALILGCNGQDGSLISRSLLKKGYEVIGVSRTNNHKNNNHISLGIEKDIQIQIGNIENFEIIEKIFNQFQPDEVYNLASQSSVGLSFKKPIQTIKSIVDGTLNILEVAKTIKYPGQLFFAGSSEIFGNTIQQADISHRQSPLSPYGIAKQSSFHLVKLYRDIYGLNCKTGVLFNHESQFRNDNFVTQKIIVGLIECLKNREHKIFLGNINIGRDWGWAEEFVEAMQLMNNSHFNKDQVICTGKLTTLKDFIKIAFETVNLNIDHHIIIDQSLYRKTDIENSWGNPSQMKEDLNWESKFSISQIVEKLITYKLNLL